MLVYPAQLVVLRDEARLLAEEARARRDILAFSEYVENMLEYDAMLTIAKRRGAYSGAIWDNAGIAITEERVNGRVE